MQATHCLTIMPPADLAVLIPGLEAYCLLAFFSAPMWGPSRQGVREGGRERAKGQAKGKEEREGACFSTGTAGLWPPAAPCPISVARRSSAVQTFPPRLPHLRTDSLMASGLGHPSVPRGP